MKVEEILGSKLVEEYGRDNPRNIKKDKTFYKIVFGNHFIITGEKPKKNTIFIVLKNADFTEGRGPMMFHKVFKDGKKAIEYILSQPGVYGSQQYIQQSVGINVNGGPFARTYFNGYEISLIEFSD